MTDIHVGRVLRELYLGTGLKMARFSELVNFSPKTIYYHFGQPHLHTSILEAYEAGLRKNGQDVDLWRLIADRRSGYRHQDTPSIAAEPAAEYVRLVPKEESVADLLRRAANMLDDGRGEEEDAPAKE